MHGLHPPHIGIAYLGKMNGGSLQLSHEIMEARWFPQNQLPAPLSDHTQLAIAAAVQAHEDSGAVKS